MNKRQRKKATKNSCISSHKQYLIDIADTVKYMLKQRQKMMGKHASYNLPDHSDSE